MAVMSSSALACGSVGITANSSSSQGVVARGVASSPPPPAATRGGESAPAPPRAGMPPACGSALFLASGPSAP
eukprot:scaffold22080_cov125-Isochrysis_galbana.AAC.9